MKSKLSLSLIVATLMASSFAQDAPRPEPPRPPDAPADAERPPFPPGEGRDRGPRDFERGDRPPRGPEDRELGDRPVRPFMQRRREGEALPEGRPPGDRRSSEGIDPRGFGDERRGRREAVEQARKPMPYIGVVTVPTPAVLNAQLGLPEGFGLVVEEVLPDSPAKTAGVQRYDVLKLLNDQQLVSPEQLARLVRGVGKDVEASLTIIRKGQEQKLTIKVGEKLLPERGTTDSLPPFRGFGGDRSEQREQMDQLRRRMEEMNSNRQGGEGMPDRMRAMQERMRAYQEALKKYQEQIQEWRKNPSGEPPQLPALPEMRPGPGGPGGSDQPGRPNVRPADLLRDIRPGEGGIRAERSQGTSRWDTSRARATMRDADGELEVVMKDGHHVLTMKSPKGDVVFEGPVDTLDQLNTVPEKIREKLKQFAPQRMNSDQRGDQRRAPMPVMPDRFERPVQREAEVQ